MKLLKFTYLIMILSCTSCLIARPSLADPVRSSKVLVETPTAARSLADCAEARRVAQKFLDLEWQGKRLYTNKDYDSIMDYTDDDGNEGDEPGWDSANLVESKPIILKCSQNDDGQISIEILYRKIGQADGVSIHLYKHAENSKETLMIRKTGAAYKVSGIDIYEPYVPIGVIERLIQQSG